MICNSRLILPVVKLEGFFCYLVLNLFCSIANFSYLCLWLIHKVFFVIYCSPCCETRRFFFVYKGKFIRQIFAYVGYYCYLCSIIIILILKYQL